MKTTIQLSLITFLCISNIAKSQTVPSSCTAADSIVKLYNDDADRLAMRHTFNFNLPYKDSITINKPLHKTYINALLAVFNAINLPARDTVVQLKIHANLGFVLNNVLFIWFTTWVFSFVLCTDCLAAQPVLFFWPMLSSPKSIPKISFGEPGFSRLSSEVDFV